MARSNLHIIYDTAATLLGQGLISDPEATEGRLINLLRGHVENVAEEVAQESDWPSCRTRIKLIAEPLALGEQLPGPFTKRYPLPLDYLRMIDLDSEASGHYGNYTIETDAATGRRVMLADFDPGFITYARLPSYDRLDPLLRSAIAARLAGRIARSITESDARAREIEAAAQQAFDRAVAATVFERSSDVDRPPSWRDAMWAGGARY
jgi:hypothetical protein